MHGLHGPRLFSFLFATIWLVFMPSMVSVPPGQPGLYIFAMVFGLPGVLALFWPWIFYLMVADWFSTKVELRFAPLAFIALVAAGITIDIGLLYGFHLDNIMQQTKPPRPAAIYGRYLPIAAAAIVALIHRTFLRVVYRHA